MKNRMNKIIDGVKFTINFIKELVVELQPLIIIYLLLQLLK